MPINKIDKKKNGLQGYRVRINYTDMNGNPRQVERTAYGLAEANLLEKQLVAEFKDKKQSTISKMTVQQLCNEYSEYHSHEIRKTSYDSAMKIIRLRILPTMADVRLDKLSQSRLAQWKNEIAATHLSIVTKQNAYAAFVSLLNYAVKMEYIPKNPLTALGNFRDANSADKPADKLHYYTAEQFLKYIAVAKKMRKPSPIGVIMCFLTLRSTLVRERARSMR